MGRAKEVVYYNGRLKGKLLTDKDCDTLESLIRIDREKGYVKDLRNIIWELSDSDVEVIKETKSSEFISNKE